MIWIAPARTQQPVLVVGIALAALTTIIGALLGFLGPLRAIAALLGISLAIWAVSDLEHGLWGTILIITLLPFGTMPF